jgi:hypothetical protein
MDGIAFTTLLT